MHPTLARACWSVAPSYSRDDKQVVVKVGVEKRPRFQAKVTASPFHLASFSQVVLLCCSVRCVVCCSEAFPVSLVTDCSSGLAQEQRVARTIFAR